MILSKNILLVVFSTLVLISCNKTKSKKEVIEVNETIVDQKEEVKEVIPNQKLTPEQQIASAVLAAPPETRDGAKVYGYDDEGNFITLREGTNTMICIADNPNKSGFQVVAYHGDLEPFMARGRELKAEGKGTKEVREIREMEAKEGKLQMPKNPSTLHVLQGEKGGYDPETGTNINTHYRYVVYTPFATQETTGLSLKPNAPGHPWLMFPGTAGAHIMISPSSGN
ncbi:hypothetical protein [Aureibaculum marinum]|uniref:hypothetical protein n=1 Tax=Aureibaculum marinum TaxID=2487930 RepID=UPI0019397386|nr:hypothetical protein [Aureibaculum marinum]